MKEKEAIEKLNALTDGDKEAAHGDADGILLQFLMDNGFAAVAGAWRDAEDRIGFWYA